MNQKNAAITNTQQLKKKIDTMKITHLINQLQSILENHGDLIVMLDDSSGNSSIASEARVQEGGYILLPDGTEKYCPDQSFVYILP